MWEICDQISSSCAQLNVGAQKVFETSWECLATVILCCFGQMRSVGAQQLSPVLQIHWGHHFANRDAGWSCSYNLCFLPCQQAVLQDVATWNCPPQFEHWQLWINESVPWGFILMHVMHCAGNGEVPEISMVWPCALIGPATCRPRRDMSTFRIQVFKDPRLTSGHRHFYLTSQLEAHIPLQLCGSYAWRKSLWLQEGAVGGTWWCLKCLRPMGGMWWTPSIRSCPTRTAEVVMGFSKWNAMEEQFMFFLSLSPLLQALCLHLVLLSSSALQDKDVLSVEMARTGCAGGKVMETRWINCRVTSGKSANPFSQASQFCSFFSRFVCTENWEDFAVFSVVMA